jgi:hypothetical protein
MVRSIRISIRRGDTNVIPFQAIDRNGRTMNLTAATVRFVAKQSLADTDADAEISKVSPSGVVIHSDPTTGFGEVIIDPTDTESLLAVVHNFSYNIQVTESSGSVETVQEGPLIVLPDAVITHP